MDTTQSQNVTRSTRIFPKSYSSVTRFVKQNIPSHVVADKDSQCMKGGGARVFGGLTAALSNHKPRAEERNHTSPSPTLPWRRAKTSTLVWSK